MTTHATTAIPTDPAYTDRMIARWGGLAGLAGSVLLAIVFVLVGVVIGPDPSGPAGPISRFPQIQAARTVENGLYLAALMLWVPLALALARRLRRSQPAAAVFGAALNVVGLTVLAAGAVPHVVTSRLAERYHAANTTPDEQAALVLLWSSNQGLFDALVLVGLLVLPVGVVLLGLAMRRDLGYGPVLGTASVALGLLGLAAALVTLVDPRSPAVALGMIAVLVFHALAGWRTYRRAASTA